ncbi:MAG: SLBB domain-containing protein [Candidatus Cloacimonetes bacterium]|nr:SLBB domain-containing protein [Candidatus Cloacimonadota bacterium]
MVTIENIKRWGVVGAGGAGFPSHVKFDAKAEIVIMNGAECEPLLHKDKELLRLYPNECIEGLKIIMDLVGASRGIIGIKGKYKEVVDVVKAHLVDGVEVCELGNYYPAGDELSLVFDTTGRVVAPGNIPLTVGCVVSNVETMLNVAKKTAVTTSFLTVAGDVQNAISIEAVIGSTLGDCIQLAGGALCEDPVMIVGGPMMGRFSDDFSELITKTTGGVVVLDRSHDLVRKYLRPKVEYDKIAKASCDGCSFCTELCPRYLLGHPIEPHKNMRSKGFEMTVDQLIAGAEFCCECNLCSFYACPEDLDPKNVSADLRKLIQQKPKEERLSFKPGDVDHHPMLEYRKAPIPKLMRKIQIDQFDRSAPMHKSVLTTDFVKIPLSQHIGAPADPLVRVGETVKVGQIIGRPDPSKLGAFVHASIAGEVTKVDQYIHIKG